MSENITIQINTKKTVYSTIKDTNTQLYLENNINAITEYNVNNMISAIDVFDIERQNTQIYRIYGSIDYLSILNGLNVNYKTLDDFFTNTKYIPDNIYINYTTKNIFNSLDFYLVKPSTGYTKIGDSNDHITYIKNYEVIATPHNFELYNAGYSKNIYNELKYLFNFNIDFDVSTYLDGFDIPITELYLYYVYKPRNNGLNQVEYMKSTEWDLITKDKSLVTFTPQSLNIGDVIYGDKIEHSKLDILDVLIEEQKYYIGTPYNDNGITRNLEWVYKPLIPFKLRYFSNEIKRCNISGTTYDDISKIPYYATDIGNGNMIWRDILPQGYIDPLTNIGVDYPFINQRRYLFNNKLLSIIPNLEHLNTYNVFKEINFNTAENINYKPITKNINDINEPC